MKNSVSRIENHWRTVRKNQQQYH